MSEAHIGEMETARTPRGASLRPHRERYFVVTKLDTGLGRGAPLPCLGQVGRSGGIFRGRERSDVVLDMGL